MNLRTQIESIASQLPNVAFRYGRRYDENINGDNESYPAIVLLEPDQFGFRVSTSNGQMYDRYNIFIQFIKNGVEVGEQASARESIVEEMRSLAAQFIVKLNSANIFKDIPENIPGVLIVEAYDANVCGIEINISNLTDTQPRHIC